MGEFNNLLSSQLTATRQHCTESSRQEAIRLALMLTYSALLSSALCPGFTLPLGLHPLFILRPSGNISMNSGLTWLYVTAAPETIRDL